MERKHQVFVSSTYKDLVEERQHVIHALLELDCIPSGMELFPAADEDAWTLIKEVIDNSDYYLLIVAGKYGSTNTQGISYTEMEFDYAVSIKKPIMCFLHHKLDDLPGSKIEKTETLQKKLEEFRGKAQEKHCKYWKGAEDLGGKISRSLVQLRKKHPADGWIPGRFAADEKLFRRLEELRSTIQELEAKQMQIRDEEPREAADLAKGVEVYSITNKLKKTEAGKPETIQLSPSWDNIFEYVGSAMTGECTEDEFREKVKLVYYHAIPNECFDFNSMSDIVLYHVAFDKIKIQLQALGLITHGSKRRTPSDINTYWKLTPYGEKYLLRVSAIKSKVKSL